MEGRVRIQYQLGYGYDKEAHHVGSLPTALQFVLTHERDTWLLAARLGAPINHIEKLPDDLRNEEASEQINAEHHGTEEGQASLKHGGEEVPVQADVLSRVTRR